MAGVKLYNKTGDAKAAKIQEGIEKKFGFVPEVFQAMGRNGDFLDLAMRIAEAAGKGLDPKTKEAVGVLSAREVSLPAQEEEKHGLGFGGTVAAVIVGVVAAVLLLSIL